MAAAFINIPKFLEPIFPLAEGEPPAWLGYVAIAMGLGGIALAFLFYVVSPAIPGSGLAKAFSGPYRWMYNKYYVDEFYEATVIEPVMDGSRELLWRVGDVRIIDGVVNGAGKVAAATGKPQAAARTIRLYPELCRLGGRRVDPDHRVYGLAGGILMTNLDLVLFAPLLGFLLLLLVPKSNPNASRMGALIISSAIFLVSLTLLAPYWYAAPTGYTISTNISWINYPPIRYHVGLDGLSLWLVLKLSTFLTPICVLISWKQIDNRVKEYFAFLVLLEFGLIGVFVSLDLFLFFTFWEISLVPMYFLIGISATWGS